MSDEPRPAAATSKGRRWRRRVLQAGLLAGTVFVGWQTFGPNPSIEVGPATTRLTAPLLSDGTPDYRRALLERLREGVTLGNNAAVPLLAAYWPHDGDRPSLSVDEAERIAAELGMPTPPRGIAFTPVDTPATREAVAAFLQGVVDRPEWNRSASARAIDEASLFELEPEEALDREAEHVVRENDVTSVLVMLEPVSRPWSADDLPFMADWVKRNEPAYSALTEASKQPRYYVPPLYRLSDGPGGFGSSSQEVVLIRDATHELVTRCNYCLGSKRSDLAAEDAVAILRLAAHAERGAFNSPRVFGFAIEEIGHALVREVASDPATDARTLALLRSGLQSIDGDSNFAVTMDLAERHGVIDTMVAIRDGKLDRIAESIEATYRETSRPRGRPEAAQLGGAHADYRWKFLTPGTHTMVRWMRVDWNETLRGVNEAFDRIVAAMRLPPGERGDALAALEAEHAARLDNDWTFDSLRRSLTPAGRGRLVADAWAALHGVGLVALAERLDDIELERRLTEAHLALRVHRLEAGVYPQSIEELANGALSTPFDPGDGRVMLVYAKTDKGYTLSLSGQPFGELLVEPGEEPVEPWPWEPGGWLHDRPDDETLSYGGYGAYGGGYGEGLDTSRTDLAETSVYDEVERSDFSAESASDGQGSSSADESLPATTSEGGVP